MTIDTPLSIPSTQPLSPPKKKKRHQRVQSASLLYPTALLTPTPYSLLFSERSLAGARSSRRCGFHSPPPPPSVREAQRIQQVHTTVALFSSLPLRSHISLSPIASELACAEERDRKERERASRGAQPPPVYTAGDIAAAAAAADGDDYTAAGARERARAAQRPGNSRAHRAPAAHTPQLDADRRLGSLCFRAQRSRVRRRCSPYIYIHTYTLILYNSNTHCVYILLASSSRSSRRRVRVRSRVFIVYLYLRYTRKSSPCAHRLECWTKSWNFECELLLLVFHVVIRCGCCAATTHCQGGRDRRPLLSSAATAAAAPIPRRSMQLEVIIIIIICFFFFFFLVLTLLFFTHSLLVRLPARLLMQCTTPGRRCAIAPRALVPARRIVHERVRACVRIYIRVIIHGRESCDHRQLLCRVLWVARTDPASLYAANIVIVVMV